MNKKILANQKRLKSFRLYHGALDGIYGQKTADAEKFYLSFRRLPEILTWLREEVEKTPDISAHDLMVKAFFALFPQPIFIHLAYLEATIWHETAGTMRPVQEAYWNSELWRQKHLRYFPWYGRGYIQLTWKRNYVFVDRVFRLNGELLRNPNLLLQDKALSMLVAVAGCSFGWFTGRKLSDTLTPMGYQLVKTRRVVNGYQRNRKAARRIALKTHKLLNSHNY